MNARHHLDVAVVDVDPELVNLSGARWYVPAHKPFHPVEFEFNVGPAGHCIAAFSTRESCEKAIAAVFQGSLVWEVHSPTAFLRRASQLGLQVLVDLQDDGEGWHYHTYPQAWLAQGGEA